MQRLHFCTHFYDTSALMEKTMQKRILFVMVDQSIIRYDGYRLMLMYFINLCTNKLTRGLNDTGGVFVNGVLDIGLISSRFSKKMATMMIQKSSTGDFPFFVKNIYLTHNA